MNSFFHNETDVLIGEKIGDEFGVILKNRYFLAPFM